MMGMVETNEREKDEEGKENLQILREGIIVDYVL